MVTNLYARFQRFTILGLVSVLLLWPAAASAQVTYGRILGTVTDASGALVPNIAVTIRSLDTGAQRSVRTTDVGYYIFPDLPIGDYEVSVEAAGFKHYAQSPLKLLVDMALRVDIQLNVGNVKEEVTVRGQASVIATDQSSVGEVIQNTGVVELPLNGRNFVELTNLVAGATQGSPDYPNRFRSYGTVMTSNGGRGEQNNYMIDGVDNSAFIIGAPLVFPSIDAIQEMKVEGSNYTADMGQASGAVVNVAIKSGSNAFHGTVYDFLRNDILDARNFFASSKLPLRQNQFGASLGGPVVKNKVFFFFNYEGFRQTESSPYFYFVPTAAMKSGDFSGTYAGQQLPTLYDPFNLDASGNRLPFPNNQIPSTSISPAAAMLLSYIPNPDSTSAGGNYEANYSTPANRAQVNARVDYNVSSKDAITARYSWWDASLDQHYLNFEGDFWHWRPRNAVVGWTHTYSPNVLQEVRFTASKYSEIVATPYPQSDYARQLGLLEFSNATTGYYFPYMYLYGMNPGFGADEPSARIEDHFQLQYHLSVVHGRNTLKFGVDTMRYQSKDGWLYNEGLYTFSGQNTAPIGQDYSNGFGDFLLGLPNYQRIQDPVDWDYERLRNTRVQSYVQDDIRVASNLTMNLGLRWDWFGPYKDKNNRIEYFDFATGQVVYPANLKLSYDLPFPHRFDPNYTAIQNAQNKQFGPRVGFAWRPFGNDRTAVQGAYGVFWGVISGYDSTKMALAAAGLSIQTAEISSSTAPTLTFGVFANDNPTNFTNPTDQTMDPNTNNPYVQQWNLGINRQLTTDMSFKVAYVGSKTKQLDGDMGVNVAYPPEPGNYLTRLAYPLFGNIDKYASVFSSNYNALEVSVERRFAKGLLFTSNYTWSKCLDTHSGSYAEIMGVENPFDLEAEYGRCEMDSRQRSTTSLVYQLPIHSKRAFLRPFVEGWETSTVIVLQSGFPFTVTANDLSNIGASSMRADYIGGNKALPSSQRSPAEWFNTSAFAQPAPLTFGNAGRDILDAPRFRNADLSLMKRFSITERMQAQFRAEFFNVFNHPYFDIPSGNNVSAPGFGSITDTVGDNREIQLGLKLIF
jgi:hypothetical protein